MSYDLGKCWRCGGQLETRDGDGVLLTCRQCERMWPMKAEDLERLTAALTKAEEHYRQALVERGKLTAALAAALSRAERAEKEAKHWKDDATRARYDLGESCSQLALTAAMQQRDAAEERARALEGALRETLALVVDGDAGGYCSLCNRCHPSDDPVCLVRRARSLLSSPPPTKDAPREHSDD